MDLKGVGVEAGGSLLDSQATLVSVNLTYEVQAHLQSGLCRSYLATHQFCCMVAEVAVGVLLVLFLAGIIRQRIRRQTWELITIMFVIVE